MRDTELDAKNKHVSVHTVKTKDLLRALTDPKYRLYRQLPKVLVPRPLYQRFAYLANQNGHSVEGLILSLMKSYIVDEELIVNEPMPENGAVHGISYQATQ